MVSAEFCSSQVVPQGVPLGVFKGSCFKVPVVESYSTRKDVLFCWLVDAKYVKAVEALEWAAAFHVGARKDEVSHEFSHQISIVNFLCMLDVQLMFPSEVYVVGFLHDVREDFNVPDFMIRNHFGGFAADAVDALTKKLGGISRDLKEVFDAIVACPVASVVKGADRIHNQQTMLGVFPPSKVWAYMEDTVDWVLPMLDEACETFPLQASVYELEKLILLSQIELISALLPNVD